MPFLNSKHFVIHLFNLAAALGGRNGMSGSARVVVYACCAVLLWSCDRDEKLAAVSIDTNTDIAANKPEYSQSIQPNENATAGTDMAFSVIAKAEQRPGDPVKGRQALITQPIVSCGLPMSVFEQQDPKRIMTLPERSGRAASLPYDVNLITDDNGVELGASNCLTCHAAPLFGELVIGLGNEFLDFTVNPSIAVERAGSLVSGEPQIAAWEKFADRIAAIAPYMQTRTAGVNPANNLTFALMAHRDPKTMSWLDEPRTVLPPTDVPPVSVPPWWRMKKKHAMFSMGEGRGDHASVMMTAAILCSDSVQEVARLDAIAPDVRAYIESLEPPDYPLPIDADLAQQGKVIFEDTCSVCHGTYGENPSYPNRLVNIDVIGTDSTLIDYAFGDGQVYVDWFNESPFGELAKAVPSRGYVAPPLDGVWSTAPFLHNGSVPTIRAVLDSTSRPELWHHQSVDGRSAEHYNQRDLGWHYAQLESGSENKTNSASGVVSELAVPGQWLYDTRKAGYKNTGHQFGDALTEQQRDAVIEYIKTL